MTDLSLPTLLATTGNSSFRLRCHAAAWCDGYSGTQAFQPGLLLLSATGSDTAAKAVRAVLHVSEIEAEFRLERGERIERMARAHYDGKPTGYTASLARLAPGAIHIVALAKLPGLIPDLSDDRLWAELCGERYTTPLLRAWTPWIRQRLIAAGGIVPAQGYAAKAGVLRATPEEIDDLASSGVRQGHLEMKSGDGTSRSENTTRCP
jgi:hypothetical protein